MSNFINVSSYQFANLSDLKNLRARLLKQCRDLGVKGTILLSTEGINLFLAGRSNAIEAVISGLRKIPGLEGLQPKVSESEEQPFTRMLVRIKKEIIAFGVEEIQPGKYTSKRMSPGELKRWLDEGRKFTLLDTRNDYEIKLGTFEGAVPIGVRHFRDFPKVAQQLPEAMKSAPVVTFCTGGIRCEKAAPFLETLGFRDVYQLEGGILKYFEMVGSEHYRGDCFVFDKRIGLDPSLQETSSTQCYACLSPLTVEEQSDARYVAGKSCPYCFKSSEERMRENIERRHRLLEKIKKPLPGSRIEDRFRPLRVPAKYDGESLGNFLKGILKHVSEATWNAEFAAGLMLGPERQVVSADRVVRAGERYFHKTVGESEPEVNADLKIVYEDEALIVVEKPAPLPVHACGRFSKNTLRYFLEKAYAPQKPLPAHRLDANTTGVMLVARTRHFAGLLQPQFMRGEVGKSYLAKVHGWPQADEFSCELALGEETEEAGARRADALGRSALTRFRVLRRLGDGGSLLEVWPVTGRTNQIRIHLWELGYPIVGDQLYLPGKKLGAVQTGAVEDSPLCLHAKLLSFTHPITRERLTFESLPTWGTEAEVSDMKNSVFSALKPPTGRIRQSELGTEPRK